MARASTTPDAFNAVAEPRRGQILSYLTGAERPVGEIVAALGLEQPSVSKHLRVLRDVGLVRMRCQARQKLYRTNADAIRPLHEWGVPSSATGSISRIEWRARGSDRPPRLNRIEFPIPES
jgi:DNA-binding transcriptional ArsR family regulator